MTEISNFKAFEGRFASASSSWKSFPPHQFWALFTDSPIASAAVKLACLPAANASTERIFSAAAFTTDHRHRLSPEKVEMEVFIRCNWDKVN